jgi:hypothetical protein
VHRPAAGVGHGQSVISVLLRHCRNFWNGKTILSVYDTAIDFIGTADIAVSDPNGVADSQVGLAGTVCLSPGYPLVL